MSAALLKTPLHDLHVELGAKMVPLAGYAMPVNYPHGIIAEHRQCREAAALFDVSHMGQLRLVGDDAARALETLVPVDVIDLALHKQRYALFTNASGGILFVADLMLLGKLQQKNLIFALERLEKYKLQLIAAQELPLLPMYDQVTITAAKANIKGLSQRIAYAPTFDTMYVAK